MRTVFWNNLHFGPVLYQCSWDYNYSHLPDLLVQEIRLWQGKSTARYQEETSAPATQGRGINNTSVQKSQPPGILRNSLSCSSQCLEKLPLTTSSRYFWFHLGRETSLMGSPWNMQVYFNCVTNTIVKKPQGIPGFLECVMVFLITIHMTSHPGSFGFKSI